MSPLPQHGRDANLIADVIKSLLDHFNREYDAFIAAPNLVRYKLQAKIFTQPEYVYPIRRGTAIFQ